LKKGKNSEFYINPKPKYTGEIVLTNDRLKRFIDSSMAPAEDMF